MFLDFHAQRTLLLGVLIATVNNLLQPIVADNSVPATTTVLPAKLESKHLPNLIQIHSKVISGGLPDGDAAFKELAARGVKTIISVDGARPDVETAKRHGLRYLHLPHGYDGIPNTRVRELALAVRDLDGPIYIHCHHGQHRSPVAATVACISAGLLPTSQAKSILELAGTSKDYRGLFESTEQAVALKPEILDSLQVDFRETADVTPMAEAMVALELTHFRLALIADAGWRSPVSYSHLEPVHQALLLQEHFAELLRTDEVAGKPEAFQEILRDSASAAQQMKAALEQIRMGTPTDSLQDLLDAAATRIVDQCKNCHERFRDIPLHQK